NRAALPQPNFRQRPLALGAGLSAATVDMQLLLEVAGAAVTADEIPQCGTALGDGVGQYPLDLARQRLVTGPADAAAGPIGADARQKQRLVGIDITDSHHDALV